MSDNKLQQHNNEANQRPNNNQQNQNNPRRGFSLSWLYLLIIGIVVYMFMTRDGSNASKSVDYTDFQEISLYLDGRCVGSSI